MAGAGAAVAVMGHSFTLVQSTCPAAGCTPGGGGVAIVPASATTQAPLASIPLRRAAKQHNHRKEQTQPNIQT